MRPLGLQAAEIVEVIPWRVMVARKPLTVIDGKMKLLPAGDTVDGVAGSFDEIELANAGGGATALPGNAVYIIGNDQFGFAQANATGTATCIGLAAASIASGVSGPVRKDGTLTQTTTDWDAVTGQTGGLTANAQYWVSTTVPGGLTDVPPTTGWLIPVGRAMSSTSMDIHLDPVIQLT
jgi:hypothetical protein